MYTSISKIRADCFTYLRIIFHRGKTFRAKLVPFFLQVGRFSIVIKSYFTEERENFEDFAVLYRTTFELDIFSTDFLNKKRHKNTRKLAHTMFSTMASISKYQRQQTRELEEHCTRLIVNRIQNSKRNRVQFCLEDARKSTFPVLIRFKKRRSQFNRDKRGGRRRTVTRFPLTGRLFSPNHRERTAIHVFYSVSFQCQAMRQSGVNP